MIYALTSDGFTYRELRDQAEFIRAELLRVSNVGKVDLIGVQEEVIYIDLSLRQMAGLGIAPELLAATLASQNAVIASGTIETPGERIAVRVSGALDSVAALENVAIRLGDRQVRLPFRARDARLQGSAIARVPLQRHARDRHWCFDGEGRQRARSRRGA